MTRDERIEAAARTACPFGGVVDGVWRCHFGTTMACSDCRGDTEAAIDAAYPELAGENPKCWLAPVEMTDDMASASLDAEIYCDIDIALTREGLVKAARLGWSAARDVYLKEGGE